MDEMSIPCKLCGHAFKFHQMSTYEIWFCDFSDDCPCDAYWPSQSSKSTKDIRVPYTGESYKWN